ncbi:chlororespiratory reduction protein 7 [Crocosphaera sp. XPORK-15E]|uniref:chlororespiratory reduction protein 7 n=1 Tax=Crocosphaera sp. XPORK-15E TaxID=3110247 RepID=UPI002B2024E3|nr:chlororespiratory reduction protein 7 [Crocosphaera sp. XPORK-15E]MEA5533278.1 chlororespiratory reduction protein 7 [Crocosphaera sp. XPORK-15E]
MPDSIMYQEDGFVVLEPDQPEQFLTAEELLEKLKAILLTRQDDLPRELQKISAVEAQARYLMVNFCDLDVGPDSYLQWYVIRLQK